MAYGLKDISLKYIIDNGDVHKLLILLTTNRINTFQKNKIIGKILSDKYLIIDVVENYYDILAQISYKNDILTLYKLITDYNESRVENYIKDMESFNKCEIAFLWFLLSIVLGRGASKYSEDGKSVYSIHLSIHDSNFILSNFRKTSNKYKILGFIRVKEFGLDAEKYFKMWDDILNYASDIHKITHIYDNRGLIFEYRHVTDNNLYIIKLYNDHTFEDYIGNNLHKRHYKGVIDKKSNGYYFSKFVSTYSIIKPYRYSNINSRILLENPYITSASKHLNDILPFFKGEVDETGEIYYGYLNGNIYGLKFTYKNKMNCEYYNVEKIEKEILNLR